MDITILLKLGLDENEIKIYLYLIKSRVQTVKQISEATLINRTSLYRYLTTLANKGLIEWLMDERGAKVQTTSPQNITVLLKNKKLETSTIEKGLPQLINDLSTQKPSEIFHTQIRYYKGKKGIQQLFWNTLQTTETTRSYAPLRRREFIDPSYEDEFEQEWANRNLKDKVITNENRAEYIKKRLVPAYKNTLNLRIIPRTKFYISNDITIYNNVIAIASLEKNNLVGIEIENKEIAKTQKSIFDLVWTMAKPL